MGFIEEKVINVGLNNGTLISGVQSTLSAMQKLQQGLQLKGGTKGLDDVDAAVKRTSFNPIANGLEAVNGKFLAMATVGITALTNITNKAVDTGLRVAKSLTIDPIKSGLAEYELQLNSVQTILANTESKGSTLKDVNGALAELNTYADKTIYNFSEMTRNIGTFTAAGVSLEASTTAIKGIANLAAVSGSNSQQASTAMYQLSQALAAGKVGLQDWNSVVNAGMGGEVFKNALMETARASGVAVDDIIKKSGSFRDSLQKGWITGDIMTKTLEKMTMATEGATEAEIQANREKLKSQGYNEKQIEEIFKLANTATNAATKVKTFTQLMETLKEAVGSGWAQSWQTIIGDFEEAKDMWTAVSDELGGFISASADARNKVLGDWKALGGRTALISGIGNVWKALLAVIEPIKEAFSEIFPPATGKQLADLTKKFADFTAKLKPGPKTIAQLKSIFKGLFAALDIGRMIIVEVGGVIAGLFKNISNSSGGLMEFLSNIGQMVLKFRNSIKDGKALSAIFETIGNVLKIPVEWLGKLFSALGKLTRGSISGATGEMTFFGGALEKLGGILKNVWGYLQNFGDNIKALVPSIKAQIGDMVDTMVGRFKSLGSGIGNALGNADPSQLLMGLTTLLSAGAAGSILIFFKNLSSGVSNMSKSFSQALKDLTGKGGMIDSFTSIFDELGGTLQAFQTNIKAGALMKIAIALGILTASVLVLSMIDTAKLGKALAALTVMFAQLGGAMMMFDKAMGKGGVAKLPAVAAGLISIAAAILILSLAVKTLSSMEWDELARGTAALGVMLAMVAGFTQIVGTDQKRMISTGIGLMAVAAAIKVLVTVVRDLSALSWEELGKGGVALTAILAVLGGFTMMAKNAKRMIATGTAMILVATALKMLVGVFREFGKMSWEAMAKGGVALAASLGVIAGAMQLMPKNMLVNAAALIVVAQALTMLTTVFSDLGGMNTEELTQAIISMASALGVIAGAMALMSGALPGAAALIIVAGALSVLTSVLQVLAVLSIAQIVTSLIALAGVFAIIGVAALVLTPAVPVILALGVAIAALGVGMLAAGGGMLAFGAGIGLLAAGVATSGTLLIGFVKQLVMLIPFIATELGKGIINLATEIAKGGAEFTAAFTTLLNALIDGLGAVLPNLLETVGGFVSDLIDELLTIAEENLPRLIDLVLDSISDLIQGITEKIPEIVNAGYDMIMGLLNGLDERLPEVIDRGVDVIINFLEGIGKASVRLVDAAIKVVVDFINGMANAIRNNQEAVNAAMRNLADAAMDALSNAFGTIGDIARNMVQGLVNGIKNGLSSVANAAKDMATSALDKAKSALGIHSPSREFMKIGQYVNEGFAIGLKSGSKDSINNAFKTMQADLKALVKSSKEDVTKLKNKLDKLTSARKKDKKAISATRKELKTAQAEQLKGEKALLKLNALSKAQRAKLLTQATKYTKVVEKLTAAEENLQAKRDQQANYKEQVRSQFATLPDFMDNKELTKRTEEANERYNSLADGVNAAADALNAANQQMSDAATQLKDQYNVLPEITAETSVEDYIKDLQKRADATLKFNEDMAVLRTMGLDDRTYSDLLARGTDMQPFIDKLKEQGPGAIYEIDKLNDLLETNASQLGKTVSEELYSAGVNSAQGIYDGLMNQLTEEEKKLDAAGTDLVGSYIKTLNDQATATRKFQADMQKLRSMGLSDAVYESLMAKGLDGQDFVTQLLTKGSAGIKEVNAATKNVNDAAESISKSASNAMYQAGIDAAAGLVKGLRDEKNGLKATMDAMANSMVSTIKKALGIKSPSRVFMGIGNDTGAGLVKGLNALNKDVKNASSKMGELATDSLQKALSNPSDLLDGSLDLNPRITPVLDLSQVQSQARSLNSLLAVNRLSTEGNYNTAVDTIARVRRNQNESALANSMPGGDSITFVQNNNSPKALSSSEIYRQTSNQISKLKDELRV